jgi:hypothetical protein
MRISPAQLPAVKNIVRPRPLVSARQYWSWTALGALSTFLLVSTGAHIATLPVPDTDFWWRGFGGLTYVESHSVFYLSIALLTMAWWALRPGPTPTSLARLATTWGLWATPLFLGAPLASRDVYSYVAVGRLAEHGANPYVTSAFVGLGGDTLSSVAFIWRGTITPYGPLFIRLCHIATAASGSSEGAAVLVVRAMELLGVGLLAMGLFLLTQSTLGRTDWAWWLALLGPAPLIAYASSGHNDVLMLGLMVCGCAFVARQRLIVGAVLLGLAVCVKLTAVLAIATVLLLLLRRRDTNRWRTLITFATVASATVALIAVVVGDGFGWMSWRALHIPVLIHTEITPVTNISHFLRQILAWCGLPINFSKVLRVTNTLALVAELVLLARLACGVTSTNWRTRLGLALLVVVFLGRTVWPWYFLWGITVLATTTSVQHTFLAVVGVATAVLVGPGGTMMIGGNGFLLTAPVLLLIVWRLVRRGAFAKSLAWRDDD